MATLTQTRSAGATFGGARGMRLFDPEGERSLDDVVRATLADASATGAADCPVCGAVALYSEGEALRCGSCASRLE
jgi:hypothetical protein